MSAAQAAVAAQADIEANHPKGKPEKPLWDEIDEAKGLVAVKEGALKKLEAELKAAKKELRAAEKALKKAKKAKKQVKKKKDTVKPVVLQAPEPD